MPIDLPSPLPPQLDEVSVLQSVEATPTSITAGGVSYQIKSTVPLNAKMLTEGVSSAANPSDAVRSIVITARASGYPAASVRYAALDATNVLVLVQAVKVTEVKGPEALLPFFDGITESDPLTDVSIERRRALASLHADRMGYQTKPALTPSEGGAVMDLNATRVGPPGSVRLEVGNPGTRFTGKVLFDFAANRSDDWGNNYSALVREAFFGGPQDDRGQYHEQSFGVTRALPWGLLSGNIRHVEFRQDLITDTVNGRIVLGDLAFNTIPYASFDTRVTAQIKADWTRKTSNLGSNNQTLQREPYPSAEIGSQLTKRSEWFDKVYEWDASLTYRHGFGDDDDKVSAADLNYQLARSALGLRTGLVEDYNLNVQVAGQWSEDILPEQQQWVFGGIGTLHAWYPGAIVGEKAWLTRMQVEHIGFERLSTKIVPLIFTEYAGAKLKLGTGTQRLADVGLGFNLTGKKYWSASVATAIPVLEKDGGLVGFAPSRAGMFVRLAALWQ